MLDGAARWSPRVLAKLAELLEAAGSSEQTATARPAANLLSFRKLTDGSRDSRLGCSNPLVLERFTLWQFVLQSMDLVESAV